LISFGVDPSDSAKQALGAALYSNTFCTDRAEVLQTDATTYKKVAGDAHLNAAVNGMNGGAIPSGAITTMLLPHYAVGTGALSASNCPGAKPQEMDVPNAVEVVFKTPYAVPDDRTYAEIECTTQ